MKQTLPGLLVQIVERWSPERNAEYLLGDLQEMYALRVQSQPRTARLYIWFDFLSLLFNGVLKPSFIIYFNSMILRNYLTVATRTLIKQRVHSSINIIGLSIGLAISLLIALFVVNEWSYDRFHQKGDQIYLLPMTWHFGGTDLPSGSNCSAGGPFMKETFPQVEQYVRITNVSKSFYKGDLIVKEDNGLYADSSFFSIFSFPLIMGNADHVLVDPNSIVLTQRTAQKYFGDNWQGALSQTVRDSNGKLYTVTGITLDVPTNSHIQFDYLISFSSRTDATTPNWDNSQFRTYLLMNSNTATTDIKNQIPIALDKKYGEGASQTVELDFVALKDIYLSNSHYAVPNTSDIFYIKIFSIIALMVVVIATVNYINLSTSRSIERALEVGVRKVMGARQRQLFFQFMTESLLVTVLSFVLAFGMARMLLPLFNTISGKVLSFDILLNTSNVLMIIAFALAISLLAGIYPAMVISRYNPVRVMKGKLKDPSSGIQLRKVLVVLQFGISIILIICTLTVSSQMKYIRNIELGFEKDKLVAIGLDSISRTRVDLFKNAVSTVPWIKGVSSSTQLPIKVSFETKINWVEGSEEDWRLIKVWGTDPDFIKTTGLTLVDGNAFSPDTPAGEWQVILNESALGFFGWTADQAINKEVTFWGSSGKVKGIVKDFYFSSVHNQIGPLVIFTGADRSFHNVLLVNSSATPAETISKLETHWKAVNPDAPFVIDFVDERYTNMYEKESRLGHIVNIFAALAILISGLGLFGLASYTIALKTKELGIRKVLGATVSELLFMVSKDFVKLVLIGFILAVPVSYYFMQDWLARFAYKVDFSWMLVATAGLMALVIAACTVMYHSVQVARNNPVESLRNE
ncbi:MAG: ABC transporter permease [Cyclobacteriaceae bacterium]|nr:ABC transporter permease [Cyclobacteriaceae bacterium]